MPVVIVHGLYDRRSTADVPKNFIRYRVFTIDQAEPRTIAQFGRTSYEAMKNDLADFFDQHQIEKASW